MKTTSLRTWIAPVLLLVLLITYGLFVLDGKVRTAPDPKKENVEKVTVCWGTDERVNFGKVTPGEVLHVIVEKGCCEGVQGDVVVPSPLGWVPPEEGGKKIIFTTRVPKTKSGLHIGLFRGTMLGCATAKGDGEEDDGEKTTDSEKKPWEVTAIGRIGDKPDDCTIHRNKSCVDEDNLLVSASLMGVTNPLCEVKLVDTRNGKVIGEGNDIAFGLTDDKTSHTIKAVTDCCGKKERIIDIVKGQCDGGGTEGCNVTLIGSSDKGKSSDIDCDQNNQRGDDPLLVCVPPGEKKGTLDFRLRSPDKKSRKYDWFVVERGDPHNLNWAVDGNRGEGQGSFSDTAKLKQGRYTLHVARDKEQEECCERDIKLTVLDMEIESPSDENNNGKIDDPGNNEFTYGTKDASTSPNQELLVPVKIRVKPNTKAVRRIVKDNLIIELSPINDSHESPGGGKVKLLWKGDNTLPGSESTLGVATFDGGSQLWTTAAKFEPLPPKNRNFGKKYLHAILFSKDGDVLCQTKNVEYEVFYPTLASNNPEESVENWFYYWNQTKAGNPHARWSKNSDTLDFGGGASAPGIFRWEDGYDGPRKRMWITRQLRTKYNFFWERRDGTKAEATGIDMFANIISHEQRHVKQIIDNNKLPFYQGETGEAREAKFAGWSFNVDENNKYYNHFNPGDDSKPGKPEVDDDGDGEVDEADEFLTGRGGDVDLDSDRDDLGEEQGEDGLDFDPANGPNNLEPQAQKAENIKEDTFSEVDWGNPGKNHKSNSYDD